MHKALLMSVALLAMACKKDNDNDGYDETDDCDDTNDSISPGATEICDGIDNDCDGSVDEGLLLTWYADADADSFGDPDSSTDACTQPSGYVDNLDDCNDTSTDFYPGAPESDCTDPNDYNCDGSVGYDDVDEDGFAACEDCNDAVAEINPAADEVCDDLDNNCDNIIDLDAIDPTTWYLDHDDDGFGDPNFSLDECDQPSGYTTNSEDCNDYDGSSYPGALEYCDGLDNDCDDETDEADAEDAATWYADTDGDDFGDLDNITVYCPDAETGDGPEGYVSDSTDCDDGDNQQYPEADEYCNGEDDDCDTDIDEDAEDASAWYIDGDTDGYGYSTSVTYDCSQPSGYVDNTEDCDDTEFDINPDATEICDDVDNDCDSAIDEADAIDALTWYLDSDSDGFGDSAFTSVDCEQPSGYVADTIEEDCDDDEFDVNPDAEEICSDGIDNDCDTTYDNCLMYVADADAAFLGELDSLGTAAGSLNFADAGDINEDGINDILIGSKNKYDYDGEAYLFYGPFSGTAVLSDADVVIEAAAGEADTIGQGVGGGDFDGDGSSDLIIAASQTDNDISGDTVAGSVNIFSNGSIGGSSTLNFDDADTIIYGVETKRVYFGATMATGDMDSDAVVDLLVSGSRAPDQADKYGTVYLIYGGITAGSYEVDEVAAASFQGAATDDKLASSTGSLAMLGDVNGDGESDLMMGCYLCDSESGASYLALGPHTGDIVVSDVDVTLGPGSASDRTGSALSAAGDADGDGLEDFWIASPREDTNGSSSGSLFLVYGSTTIDSYDGSDVDSLAAVQVYGASSSDEFGATFDADGDFDGDGNNDLIVGLEGVGPNTEGTVYLFFGPLSGSINADSADAKFHGNSSGDKLGNNVSFLGDVDGTGTGAIIMDAESDDNAQGTDVGGGYLILDFGL